MRILTLSARLWKSKRKAASGRPLHGQLSGVTEDRILKEHLPLTGIIQPRFRASSCLQLPFRR